MVVSSCVYLIFDGVVKQIARSRCCCGRMNNDGWMWLVWYDHRLDGMPHTRMRVVLVIRMELVVVCVVACVALNGFARF